jgi:hypothetical protein
MTFAQCAKALHVFIGSQRRIKVANIGRNRNSLIAQLGKPRHRIFEAVRRKAVRVVAELDQN